MEAQLVRTAYAHHFHTTIAWARAKAQNKTSVGAQKKHNPNNSSNNTHVLLKAVTSSNAM